MGRGLPVILLLGLLLVAARQPHASPAPSQVAGIVRQLLPLEEEIEANHWSQARQNSTAVGTQLEALEPAAKRTLTAQLNKIKESLATLQAELDKHDAATSYRAYFSLRQNLFELLDAVGYPSAPILLLVRHDLEVARRAADEQKWQDVSHELNELELNYRSALQTLDAKGISPQQTADTLVKIGQARDALQEGDRKALAACLEELDHLLAKQQQGAGAADVD